MLALYELAIWTMKKDIFRRKNLMDSILVAVHFRMSYMYFNETADTYEIQHHNPLTCVSEQNTISTDYYFTTTIFRMTHCS